MLRKYFFISTLLLLNTSLLTAQIPDWSTAVAPIIYNKCGSCHHAGGAGHGDLTNYDTASYLAGAINFHVGQGTMPPWPPDPSYVKLAHERRLSASEIITIQNWVQGGTPQGDTNLLPPMPNYNGGAMLTLTPDYTFQMPTYTVTPTGSSTDDIYWNFVLSTNNSQDQFLKGFEFIPGNTANVHHALIFIDTGNTVINLDNAYPGLGYPGFGGSGSNTAVLIGAYVPGSTPFLFPNGFGMKYPKNAHIILSIHYPYEAVGEVDSSKINLFLASANAREVFFAPALNHSSNLQNGPLVIPANQIKTFHEQYQIPIAISLFGVAPHMHLIGRNINAFGITTLNDTIPLINIPDWNFKWQGTYYFPQIKKLPINTTLHSYATYDNTSANPFNPNSPPQLVVKGESTTDEMMLVYFAYTYYFPGDENIIIDSHAVFTPTHETVYYRNIEVFPAYPNPSIGVVNLKLYTKKEEELKTKILDMSGRIVFSKTITSSIGYQIVALPCATLATGNYSLHLESKENTYQQQISIRH
ncbi:MAG: T9SS type A sorting domain-containing protein [Chitinophagaceae bacterium]